MVRFSQIAIICLVGSFAVADQQTDVIKFDAVHAPHTKVGRSIEAWLSTLGKDYTYRSDSAGKILHTGEPAILVMIRDSGVEALFSLNASSGTSLLLRLKVSNRELLQKLQLPFDINDLTSIDVLGVPDSRPSRKIYEWCGGATCAEMTLRVENGRIENIEWFWEYD